MRFSLNSIILLLCSIQLKDLKDTALALDSMQQHIHIVGFCMGIV